MALSSPPAFVPVDGAHRAGFSLQNASCKATISGKISDEGDNDASDKLKLNPARSCEAVCVWRRGGEVEGGGV